MTASCGIRLGQGAFAGGHAETQLYLADSTWGYPEFNDDGDFVSSGSMSLDLGEMWRYGCPRSPDWDSELDMNSVEEEEEERESVMDHLRRVTERASVREFLTSDDGLYMRTTAMKWNIAGLCGPFAELFFFLLKKDGKDRPLPPSTTVERHADHI